MHAFKALKTPRVSDGVAEQIKQAIFQDHLKAGEKLPPERQLAEEFQVSRVAIREALRALENAGFITTRQGTTGGTFVTDLTLENISKAFLDLFLVEKFSIPELCQARLLLEPEVAKLAAENITPSYARQLKRALEVEQEPLTSLSQDLENKTLVHHLLLEICGNRLYKTLDQLLLGITRQVVEAVSPDPHSMHPAGMHRPIVEAVIAGDAPAASEAMKEHATEFGNNLVRMENEYRRKISSGAWTPSR